MIQHQLEHGPELRPGRIAEAKRHARNWAGGAGYSRLFELTFATGVVLMMAGIAMTTAAVAAYVRSLLY
jgi:hypothetical protein